MIYQSYSNNGMKYALEIDNDNNYHYQNKEMNQ